MPQKAQQKSAEIQALKPLRHPILYSSIVALILSIIAMTSLRTFTLNKQIFNPALYAQIQTLWFSTIPAGAAVPPAETMQRWFQNPNKTEKAAFDAHCTATCSAALDALAPALFPLPITSNASHAAETAAAADIVAPFQTTIDPAAIGDADADAAAETALSLVLLLDQMPRNIFRGDQARIYGHYDIIARALVRSILAATPRLDLTPAVRHVAWRRLWFYMPLVHSEHREDHVLRSRLMDELIEDMRTVGPEEVLSWLEEGRKSGNDHEDIIKRFGRYPYRNKVMGRETTKEEQEWIDGGGATFGAA